MNFGKDLRTMFQLTAVLDAAGAFCHGFFDGAVEIVDRFLHSLRVQKLLLHSLLTAAQGTVGTIERVVYVTLGLKVQERHCFEEFSVRTKLFLDVAENIKEWYPFWVGRNSKFHWPRPVRRAHSGHEEPEGEGTLRYLFCTSRPQHLVIRPGRRHRKARLRRCGAAERLERE